MENVYATFYGTGVSRIATLYGEIQYCTLIPTHTHTHATTHPPAVYPQSFSTFFIYQTGIYTFRPSFIPGSNLLHSDSIPQKVPWKGTDGGERFPTVAPNSYSHLSNTIIISYTLSVWLSLVVPSPPTSSQKGLVGALVNILES